MRIGTQQQQREAKTYQFNVLVVVGVISFTQEVIYNKARKFVLKGMGKPKTSPFTCKVLVLVIEKIF